MEVGEPDQSKLGDEVSSPIFVEKREACNQQEDGSDVVAEAVFTSKQVKQFALIELAAVFALSGAPFPRFAKDFFVRYGPGNAGDGNGKKKQESELPVERHRFQYARLGSASASAMK